MKYPRDRPEGACVSSGHRAQFGWNPSSPEAGPAQASALQESATAAKGHSEEHTSPYGWQRLAPEHTLPRAPGTLRSDDRDAAHWKRQLRAAGAWASRAPWEDGHTASKTSVRRQCRWETSESGSFLCQGPGIGSDCGKARWVEGPRAPRCPRGLGCAGNFIILHKGYSFSFSNND